MILELGGLGDSDELLPDIVTAEEAEEGLRHLVEAVDEAFTILKCSGLHPLAELRKRFAVAVCKGEHQESFDSGSLDDEIPEQPRARLCFV